jgi:hypothetical protein
MTPRLLLLTIDRLPAWMLSAWGATWVSTPAIDGLAGRGLVCDRLVATSLDPLRTLVDLAGGLLAAAAAAGLEPQLVTDDAGVAAAMAVEAHQVEVVPAVVAIAFRTGVNSAVGSTLSTSALSSTLVGGKVMEVLPPSTYTRFGPSDVDASGNTTAHGTFRGMPSSPPVNHWFIEGK